MINWKLKHCVKYLQIVLNRKIILIAVVFLNSLFTNLFAQFDVKEFGAKGDGKTLDTQSIQKAIDRAFDSGGGTVEVTSGTYLISTLILKDNVRIYLMPGAILLGSPDINDYPEIIHRYDSRTNGLYAKHFMFFAEGVTNISITGSGTIDGNGLVNYQKSDPQNLRPFMIRLVNCSSVSIRDVRLLESANWTLHLLGCRDVNIEGITIENGTDANRDGLDIDACERVTVSNSRFRTGDDALVMKSTNDSLCHDIAVTNCIFRTNASAIKTGTESNGGFRNITVSNCIIKDIPRHAGIELMTVDGGIMQNIVLENIIMENVATPFFIRLGNRARPYKPGQYVSKAGDVKEIILNNIIVLNSKLPSSIIGMKNKKICNITVNNYSVRSSFAQQPVPYNEVPFEEFSYPAASVFKNLPAYGIYCRNVEDLHLGNICMYSAENETRPALAFDNVENLELISVRGEVNQQTGVLAYFRNVKNAAASSCRSIGKSLYLFGKEEKNVENLILSNNILTPGQEEVIEVPSLKDEYIFEDFPTDLKYSVLKCDLFKGLPAWDLDKEPLRFNMDITKRGSLQLCLLILNSNADPSKVLVRYDGITQEFTINWNEWGWAAITLIKEYPVDRKVDFEIVPGSRNSELKISKAYIRYQDVQKTD